MVSIFTILALCFSLLACFAFPIILCIVFMRKTRPGALPLIMGIIVFIVFALILEQIMHWAFLIAIPQTKSILGSNIWLYATYGGLAAGIFEEVGRFFAFKFFLKKKTMWKHGVTYGIGHGGIEALLIVFPVILNSLIYAVLINSGSFDAMLSPLPQATVDVLLKTKDALLSEPSWYFALGGLERIFTITIQIALSLLVLYAVSKKKYAFFFLAILLHAALDFPAALAQGGILPIYAVEGIVAVCAAVSLIFILKSKNLFAAIPEVNVPREPEKLEQQEQE